MKTLRTTDYADATDKEAVAFRKPRPNHREVLDCACPLALSDGQAPPLGQAIPAVARCGPKAPEDWRSPRRCRGFRAPAFPIRAIREIRGHILRALLLGAVGLAGGAGAATLTVTNLADNGPGTLRQHILDASPGDTIDFAVTGTITLTNGQLLVASNMTIAGPNPANLAVNGNHSSRVFRIGSNAVVTISGLTITNGFVAGYLVHGGLGGGILNDHATLTVSNCTLIGNSGSDDGGAGAICNNGVASSSASLTLVNCTLRDNTARQGGGIWNVGAYGGSALLRIVNSTLSGNSAVFGGVFYHDGYSGGSATMEIVNSTLDNNSAVVGGGIFNFGDAGTLSLKIGSTILKAGASGRNIVSSSGTAPGSVSSLGYNLSSDAAGGYLTSVTDQINTDPLLGPLQDNGGPTWTHALRPGSPALDAGHSGGLATDQRGGARAVLSTTNSPPGDGSDIGAFEAGGFVRLTSLTRTNSTAHLQFTKDATTAPVPVDHVQRRAVFGPGDWADLPVPLGDTNALVPFLDSSATNGQNFYRVRVERYVP